MSPVRVLGARHWQAVSASPLPSVRADSAPRSGGCCLPSAWPAAATNWLGRARTDRPPADSAPRSIESSIRLRALRRSRLMAATVSMYFSSPRFALLPSSPHEMSARGGSEFQQKLSHQRDARRSVIEWHDGLGSVQVFVISHYPAAAALPKWRRCVAAENWRSPAKTGDNGFVSHRCCRYTQAQASHGRAPR
jgi:hypothetical protein